jgi:hypothetical protein
MLGIALTPSDPGAIDTDTDTDTDTAVGREKLVRSRASFSGTTSEFPGV